MKAVILARVSTSEQVEGQSLDAQVARLLEYCERKEFDVIKVFEITESSTRGERKKFKEMLDYALNQNEKVAIVADTVDRIQRSFNETGLLSDLTKSGKIELHFYRESMIINEAANSSDILRWDFYVLGAKAYVINSAENIRRSQQHKLKNGESIGKAPTGYLNIRDENGKATVILDANRAFHIKRLFNEYATGVYSIREMAKRAKEWGLTNKKSGQPLTQAQIHKIIRNPFYYGVMSVKDKLYPHKYATIIDLNTFEACQAVREGYGKKTTVRQSEKPFVFRGLVKCAHCGCQITSDIKKGKYIYLFCSKAKGHCDNKRSNEAKLLEQLQDLFDRFHIPDAKLKEIHHYIKESHDSKQQYQKDLMASFEDKRRSLTRQKDVLLDLRLQESITHDEYDKKLADLQRKLQAVENQMRMHTDASDKVDITLSLLIGVVSNAGNLFKSSKLEQKRQLINLVLSNLEMRDGKLVYELNAPFKDLLELPKCQEWWSVGDSNSWPSQCH